MQRVLLTGASGFIGHHLAQFLLDQEAEVWCLVRKSSRRDRLEGMGCRFVEGNVMDQPSLHAAIEEVRPQALFHLAGVTKSIRQNDLYEVNRHGTSNVLSACGAAVSSPVVVLVSTLAAVGPARVNPMVETDEPSPVSHYGRSKLEAEKEAVSQSSKLPISIVRPPVVFGPYDRDTFEMFKSISSTGLHPVPSLLRKMSLSWIQVHDLCKALWTVALRGSRLTQHSHKTGDGVYFATSPEIVDYPQLGRQIANTLGNKFFFAVPTAAPAVWGLALVNELLARVHGRQNILNFDKAREATSGSWTCSWEKLKDETGFECEVTLSETLHSSADWYRQAGWL